MHIYIYFTGSNPINLKLSGNLIFDMVLEPRLVKYYV